MLVIDVVVHGKLRGCAYLSLWVFAMYIIPQPHKTMHWKDSLIGSRPLHWEEPLSQLVQKLELKRVDRAPELAERPGARAHDFLRRLGVIHAVRCANRFSYI